MGAIVRQTRLVGDNLMLFRVAQAASPFPNEVATQVRLQFKRAADDRIVATISEGQLGERNCNQVRIQNDTVLLGLLNDRLNNQVDVIQLTISKDSETGRKKYKCSEL